MAPGAQVARTVVVLGVVTIAAYGSTFYAFGVLVEPIHLDTGWSRGAIGAAYSLSLVLGGLGAAVGGRLVDGWGPRRVLVAAAVLGAVPLGAAGSVPGVVGFVVVWGAAAGVVGGLAFYHVTMTLTVRATGGADPRAFAALTVLGGLSSPIYLPLTALLVEALGWREAQWALGGSLALVLLAAAAVLPPIPRPVGGADPASVGGLGRALRIPAVRWFVVGTTLAALVGAALNTFQVAALQAAGLSLAAASGLAAIRGLASLPGRALLSPVVHRLGTVGALSGAYLAMAAGTGLLVFASVTGLPVAYALVTGLVYGAVLPLQTLVGTEVFSSARLGTLLGSHQAVMSIVSAAGPVLGGWSVDLTGSFTPMIVVIAAGFLVSARLAGAVHPDRGAATGPEPGRLDR